MRRITYRIWDKFNKKWMTPVELPKYWMETQQVGDMEDEPWYTEDNFEFMVCTNLEDDNGKLIWEGDILRTSYYDSDTDTWDREETALVIYDDFDCSIKLTSPDDCWDLWNDPDVCKLKIIGNIYENPELLEDK